MFSNLPKRRCQQGHEGDDIAFSVNFNGYLAETCIVCMLLWMEKKFGRLEIVKEKDELQSPKNPLEQP